MSIDVGDHIEGSGIEGIVRMVEEVPIPSRSKWARNRTTQRITFQVFRDAPCVGEIMTCLRTDLDLIGLPLAHWGLCDGRKFKPAGKRNVIVAEQRKAVAEYETAHAVFEIAFKKWSDYCDEKHELFCTCGHRDNKQEYNAANVEKNRLLKEADAKERIMDKAYNKAVKCHAIKPPKRVYRTPETRGTGAGGRPSPPWGA